MQRVFVGLIQGIGPPCNPIDVVANAVQLIQGLPLLCFCKIRPFTGCAKQDQPSQQIGFADPGL
jgi:hypothetical protein